MPSKKKVTNTSNKRKSPDSQTNVAMPVKKAKTSGKKPEVSQNNGPLKIKVTNKRKSPDSQDNVAMPVKRAKTSRKKPEAFQNDDPKVKELLRQVTTSGIILTCGQGDTGQLGLGDDILEKTRFAQVPNLLNIVAIAGSGMHNVCLTDEGKVITFGCNDEGALGRDTNEGGEATPGLVDLPGRAIQVTAGDSHSAALMEDGRVFVWGSFRDSHGTLGLLTKNKESAPVQILSNKKFIKIASGSDHLVLLDNTRKVFTCGCAEQGQLGRLPERKTDRHSGRGGNKLLTPDQVYFKINKKVEIENIWAGSYATFAKNANTDDLYVFGLNNYGQIGLKNCDKSFHPKVSDTFSGRKWVQISSGQHHTIALDDKGQVYILGRKEYGRLGLGIMSEDATELVLVPKLSNTKCIDVAAGTAQSFAVTENGKLYAWGMGSEGQLGTGEEDDILEPRLIESKYVKEVEVLRVSGGGQHTIILAKKSIE
ncbi:regulator of chromosome condensation [Copidosoma floridanum]|uniref:regulator of chromosome condensation n=1 Tax=Copidosoma floridanum TaxID=29053 RepID=UPI0006C9BDFE|nr:regulator of chromosome condensation [Copidosoma floridanum]